MSTFLIIILVILAILVIWGIIYSIQQEDIFAAWILIDCLGDILQALGECLSSIDWSSDD